MQTDLLLFLVLFPILGAFAVFPLGKRSPAGRDWYVRIVPAV